MAAAAPILTAPGPVVMVPNPAGPPWARSVTYQLWEDDIYSVLSESIVVNVSTDIERDMQEPVNRRRNWMKSTGTPSATRAWNLVNYAGGLAPGLAGHTTGKLRPTQISFPCGEFSLLRLS